MSDWRTEHEQRKAEHRARNVQLAVGVLSAVGTAVGGQSVGSAIETAGQQAVNYTLRRDVDISAGRRAVAQVTPATPDTTPEKTPPKATAPEGVKPKGSPLGMIVLGYLAYKVLS